MAMPLKTPVTTDKHGFCGITARYTSEHADCRKIPFLNFQARRVDSPPPSMNYKISKAAASLSPSLTLAIDAKAKAMKAGCNGCLNFSILDGWWREGYDGTNGFAIGGDSNPNNVEEQDRVDSANLYQTLTGQVIPMFFDRDEQGIPRQWIQRIRRAMVTLVPQFTTDRMVKEYTRKYYLTK